MQKIPKEIQYLHVITSAPQNERGIIRQLYKSEGNKHWLLFDSTAYIKKIYPEWEEFEEISLFLPASSKLARIYYIYRLFSKCKHIVLHGMYFTRKIYYFLFCLFPRFLKKTIWIEWGADLYEWKEPEFGTKQKIKNKMGMYIRQNVSSIVFTFPTDEFAYKKLIGGNTKNQFWHAPLPSIRPMLPRIDEARPTSHSSSKRVRIQIAHNGFLFNNHVHILSLLSRFRDEEVQVVLPFAYNLGDIHGLINKRQYRIAIRKVANDLLGDKAVMFTKMIPLDDYFRYLWSIDIAIFDFRRPCGIGNILFLLYMGKKVFLPSEGDFYQFLTSKGMKVYDTNLIEKMSYEEFIFPPEKSDLTWLTGFYNYEENLMLWNKLFSDLEQTH